MKILLLNPPGDKIYLRDYYCSKISKASYILHPVDLCILSGILSERHRIRVIDAIVERISDQECIQEIAQEAPDVIIFLTGQVSYKKDFYFMKRVKEFFPKLKIIGTGDIFMERNQYLFEDFPFLDATILDFTAKDILSYLDGQKAKNIMSREGGEEERSNGVEFQIPIPRHELFKNKMYQSPFMKYSPIATVLTDYGCPYQCDFCIMNKIGYKFRSVNNVIEELGYIKHLGIKEIYFDDQTFGANKKRSYELLERMRDMNFSWSCLSRVDVLSDEMLDLMKMAGCHTIIFGIESGSQRILDLYHKNITKDMIRKTFKSCKKKKISIVGTFLIGLPGEQKEDVLETIRFSKELGCDYASFNVPVARARTGLRQMAINSSLVGEKDLEADQSGAYGAIGTSFLSSDDIRRLKRKAEFEFYCRLSYIMIRIWKTKSFRELAINIKNGLSILGRQ